MGFICCFHLPTHDFVGQGQVEFAVGGAEADWAVRVVDAELQTRAGALLQGLTAGEAVHTALCPFTPALAAAL